MAKEITLMDGAIGTFVTDVAARHGIQNQREPVWYFNITHPEFVAETAQAYLEAGAKCILTNTFTANRPAVEHFTDLEVAEVVKAGVRITREAVAGTDVKVTLSVGPLSEMLEPYGDLEEEECAEIYKEVFDAAFAEGGVDVIFLMTFIDLEMLTIAAKTALGYGVPVFASMSFAGGGRTVMGNSVPQIVGRLEPLGISAIGLNCSLGPVEALPILKEYKEHTKLPLIFKPNSGLASAGTVYTAEQFAEEAAPAFEIADYIGGCCGCDASYVKALKKKLEEG